MSSQRLALKTATSPSASSSRCSKLAQVEVEDGLKKGRLIACFLSRVMTAHKKQTVRANESVNSCYVVRIFPEFVQDKK